MIGPNHTLNVTEYHLSVAAEKMKVVLQNPEMLVDREALRRIKEHLRAMVGATDYIEYAMRGAEE